MTSITNKTAHSAVSASLKSADMSVIKNRSSMNESDLQAELIEVIPELPFNDSEDDFSEYSDDIEQHSHSFHLNDENDDDEEPFDEYAYQVMSNHSEPQTIWFDNSQLKSLPMNGNSTGDSDDVILIDDDDSDGDFNENSNGGLTHEPSGNSSSAEQKVYSCDICKARLSSSYNLKRHMMIHSGEKPFECDICKRRFREQSDLRKHKKVHNNISANVKCSVCNRNQPSSRNSTKCVSCEKQQETTKRYNHNSVSDNLVPRIDANNKKAFVCKYCDRAFGSSSNLKRHVMIHTGEKPFSCSECKRPFREMSTLKKHLITHRKQNGFNSNTVLKTMSFTEPKQLPMAKPLKLTQFPHSLHKCPLCKTICRGTENLMNHITTIHRPNIGKTKNNGSSDNTMRKHSKSPPPLIPINKAAFNCLNAKRI
ncbi:zinc finger protein 431-like [Contarinia nasturtii]|uniref:zinc finger protein 431-like n=1 Tax=Contarinia nasturtii TaxID=265458 RepID=UPI0012D42AA6|nr:zinc finger protein 431-like [Contarinia nasturtii]